MIVEIAEDIPADQADMIDECVKMITSDTDLPSILSLELQSTPATASTEDSVVTTSKSSHCSVGDICVACLSVDGVWYNARVESEVRSGEYQVTSLMQKK